MEIVNRIKAFIGFTISSVIDILKIRKQVLDCLLSDMEKYLCSLQYQGYLKEAGWINSFMKNKSCDQNDQPLPWATYPFIDFIRNRLRKQFHLFEYGSGNSTLFYSKHISSVTSVEHNKEWYEKLIKIIPGNVILMYEELEYDGKYCRAAVLKKRKYEIIIIDGRDRVNCIKHSLKALKVHGVIILDDSERHEYIKGRRYLIKNGFNSIDLWGISPGSFLKKCTTIFYKEKNCLGI